MNTFWSKRARSFDKLSRFVIINYFSNALKWSSLPVIAKCLLESTSGACTIKHFTVVINFIPQ